MFPRFKRSTKRLFILLTLLPTALLILGTLYMLGMTHLEGTPRTFLQGLQWASETMTTTGYGGDNHWNHPVLATFVIIVPFLGLFLAFLIFPLQVQVLILIAVFVLGGIAGTRAERVLRC